jgi:RNA polymerase sigma-70 factor (ECF subfamily)
MTPDAPLAAEFEAERPRLLGMAYRMLGSLAEAEDAVQDAWLRLGRAEVDAIENLGGWLTTALARLCLDRLRARKARREEPLEATDPDMGPADDRNDPERELALADETGVALLVVLDQLAPAERVAFVLHDVFDLPFETIAPIVDRSPEAARQLASRARRRVRGPADIPAGRLRAQRETVAAYIAATRAGDLAGVLAILDPDVVLRVDPMLLREGMAGEVRGASAVSKRALGFPRRARSTGLALVDGTWAIVAAEHGRLTGVGLLDERDGRIVGIETVADPQRLAALDIKWPG